MGRCVLALIGVGEAKGASIQHLRQQGNAGKECSSAACAGKMGTTCFDGFASPRSATLEVFRGILNRHVSEAAKGQTCATVNNGYNTLFTFGGGVASEVSGMHHLARCE